jgi:hypothetical protein
VGFMKEPAKELWASLWSLSDQIKDYPPWFWCPISDTRMTTDVYQHVAPDHVVNGGGKGMRQACAKSSTECTHTLHPLLSQMSFQHPSLFCWYCQRCTNKLFFANCQLCHELLITPLFDQPDQNNYKTVRCTTTDCCSLHNCQLCQQQQRHGWKKKLFSVWS